MIRQKEIQDEARKKGRQKTNCDHVSSFTRIVPPFSFLIFTVSSSAKNQ